MAIDIGIMLTIGVAAGWTISAAHAGSRTTMLRRNHGRDLAVLQKQCDEADAQAQQEIGRLRGQIAQLQERTRKLEVDVALARDQASMAKAELFFVLGQGTNDRRATGVGWIAGVDPDRQPAGRGIVNAARRATDNPVLREIGNQG